MLTDKIEIVKKYLNTIDKDSKLIITTNRKNNSLYYIEKINKNEFILHISKKVKKIKELLANNKNINEVVFDNWDTSNIDSMFFSFSGLVLKSFPDFSKLDLSSVTCLNGLFLDSKIMGNCYFYNDTLNNLRHAYFMFQDFTCDNLYIELNSPCLENMNFAFLKLEAKTLSIKSINNEKSKKFNNMLEKAKVPEIDLTNLNVLGDTNVKDFLKGTVSEKILMPKTITKNQDVGSVSDKIKKIYCNKKWADII